MRYQACGDFAVTARANGSHVARNIPLRGVKTIDLGWHPVIAANLARLRTRIAMHLRLDPRSTATLCKACLVMVSAQTLTFMRSLASRHRTKASGARIQCAKVAFPTPPTFASGRLGANVQLLSAISASADGSTAYSPSAETPAPLTTQYPLPGANLDTAINARIRHDKPPVWVVYSHSVLQPQGGVK